VARLLSEVYTTRIPEGMHVFGSVPEGARRPRFIAPVLNYDGHVHALVARMLGLDMRITPSKSAILGVLDRYAMELIAALLEGRDPESSAALVFGERLAEADTGGISRCRKRWWRFRGPSTYRTRSGA